jgi:hypothetical protein
MPLLSSGCRRILEFKSVAIRVLLNPQQQSMDSTAPHNGNVAKRDLQQVSFLFLYFLCPRYGFNEFEDEEMLSFYVLVDI